MTVGDGKVHSWSPDVQIPSTCMHAIATLVTILRLLYRWHLSRFWWEDAWAALALLFDILCLVAVWMRKTPIGGIPPQNIVSGWLVSVALTSVVWFARMSILCSIVRIASPTPRLRRVAYCIGILFLAMQAGLVAQKIFMCVKFHCFFTDKVAIAQLSTDIISDIILVAASVRFLRDIKLTRNRRILIMSAFSASILITIVTIFHSILLFQDATDTTIVISHAKAALALLVCNALVIVMFVYRQFQKSGVDLEHSTDEGCCAEHGSRAIVFTSIIDSPSKFSSLAYPLSSDVQGRGDIVPDSPRQLVQDLHTV